MNILKLESIKKKLKSSETNVALYILERKEKGSIVKSVNIDNKLAEGLKRVGMETINKLEKSLEQEEETVIKRLDLNNELKKHFYIELEEIEEYGDISKGILEKEESIGNLKDIENKRKIRCFIISYEYVESDKKYYINLFQKFSETKAFIKKKFICLNKEGKYVSLDKEYICLEDVGDAIAIDEDSKMLVVNKASFEVIFKYHELHKEFTNKFVDEFSNSEIKNIGSIKERLVKSKIFSREVYKISKEKRYEKIDIETLEKLNLKLKFGLEIKEGVWEIKPENDIKTVLSILRRGIVKDALNKEEEYYMSNSMERLGES